MSAAERMITLLFGGTALLVFLFASAPPELPESDVDGRQQEATIPVSKIVAILAAENDIARSLYTSEIVGAGKAVGLQFSEHWQDEGIEAGPLPALFLRATATTVRELTPDLGLFLGSAFPIASSNLFSDSQLPAFRQIMETHEAVMFADESTGQFTAMYPDFASVDACVTCHNRHPDSPKSDWRIGDIMGATTWTYPRRQLSAPEAMQMITSLRSGFIRTYTEYLERAKGFSRPPVIGDRWPSDGDYCLPSADAFRMEFCKRAALQTSTALLNMFDATE